MLKMMIFKNQDDIVHTIKHHVGNEGLICCDKLSSQMDNVFKNENEQIITNNTSVSTWDIRLPHENPTRHVIKSKANPQPRQNCRLKELDANESFRIRNDNVESETGKTILLREHPFIINGWGWGLWLFSESKLFISKKKQIGIK